MSDSSVSSISIFSSRQSSVISLRSLTNKNGEEKGDEKKTYFLAILQCITIVIFAFTIYGLVIWTVDKKSGKKNENQQMYRECFFL